MQFLKKLKRRPINRSMENSAVKVRRGALDDIELLSKLGSSTFYETYFPTRPRLKRDFQAYIQRNYSPESIRTKLTNPKIIYLIAEVGDRPMGYCKINLAKSPQGEVDKKWIKLEEIYVTKDMQAKGVGRTLMEEYFRIASVEEADIAWLGVWDGNQKAIDYYKKWGFEPFGSEEFRIDQETDIDLLMKKELK